MSDPIPDCNDTGPGGDHKWTTEGTLRGFRVCERCGLHTRIPDAAPVSPPCDAPVHEASALDTGDHSLCPAATDSLAGMPCHLDASAYPKWTATEWPAIGGARTFAAVPRWVPGADLSFETIRRGIQRARASEPTSATELVTLDRAEARIVHTLVDPDRAGRHAYLDLMRRHVEEHVKRWTGEAPPFYVDPVTRAVWGPSGLSVPPEAMSACESGAGIAPLPLAPPRPDMSAWADEWDLLPDA